MSSKKFKSKKSWREKVNEIEGKIVEITPEWEKRYGKGKLLIPKALNIEQLINRTAKGDLITHDQIRDNLATKANVQATCPLTTGIFLRIISEASEEERPVKKEKVTPYWRVLKGDGLLNSKFPGGLENQVKLLESEEHNIEFNKTGSKAKAANFENYLVKL
ncbi:MAG: hypothetical protein COA57_11530 [Flavobacteriales bacterium]|nr:MAG: hypothetical protein COA57_11530 [Flavobacteriales bacterium]